MKHCGISIKDFSDEEKIIFKEIIDILKNKIENKLIFDKIGFVKVDNSIEGGLPIQDKNILYFPKIRLIY